MPHKLNRMFSKACEYGIKSLIYLAKCQREGLRGSLKDIAEAIGSPEAFTAKILQQLVRAGLLVSLRGPSGGFDLAKNAQEIMLYDVVAAIDGPGITRNCVLGLSACSEQHPCPVHHQFKAIRDHLTGMLKITSLESIDRGMMINKMTVLK